MISIQGNLNQPLSVFPHPFYRIFRPYLASEGSEEARSPPRYSGVPPAEYLRGFELCAKKGIFYQEILSVWDVPPPPPSPRFTYNHEQKRRIT